MQAKLRRPKLSRHTLIAMGVVLIILPAVMIACGGLMQTAKLQVALFDRALVLRLHYAVSLLMILGTLALFMTAFEQRKPQARELVVIATLAAIAVAGRAAFFMLPQFKPMCAIVIIAGVCFGGEAGFLVGAVSAFASNAIFGQGAHTPWQMFCFGIVGFVEGLLARAGVLSKKRIPLCIYGGLATFLLYGGIINIGMMFMFEMPLTRDAILAFYISAFPMDLIHAAATVFFLFVLSNVMIEKLERIKIKYGLICASRGQKVEGRGEKREMA